VGVAERCVAVVLHDVAPATWATYRPLLRELDAWRVPLTLLVVPWWHGGVRVGDDPAWRAALDARVARGDEIALHGWRHLDEGPAPRSPYGWVRRRVLTAGEGEFAALSSVQAAQRLAAGRAALEECGWHAEGFVAPAWLLGASAAAAVRAAGFSYTSDRTALYLLPNWRRVSAPTLVASPRSAARRFVSRAWNRWQLATAVRAPLLRIGIHPGDCQHPAQLRRWRAVLREVLGTRTAVTKAQWCAAVRQGA
jgi:uncharacterized protein